MSYDDAPVAPTTLDLLGRRWALDAPVEAACFARDGLVAAFRAGGALHVAGADPEDAATRIRMAADTGRLSILPRSKPVRPLERAAGVAGAVCAFGARGFLTGLASGGLASVTARGQVTPLRRGFDAPPAAAVADPASTAVAAAAGARVAVLREDGADDALALPDGAATALAFAADGGALAAGTDTGLVLFRRGAGRPAFAPIAGGAAAVAFSPDGRFVAVACGAEGVAIVRLSDLSVRRIEGFPTPVRTVDFAAGALVASGAFRLAAWRFGPEGLEAPIATGRPGLVAVERTAPCPARALAAAGYANGLVLLSRPGAQDEMMLRDVGGPVSTLAFSPDGQRLVLGDAAGEAALVALPPALFKQGDAA
jgi:hypothetical protein